MPQVQPCTWWWTLYLNVRRPSTQPYLVLFIAMKLTGYVFRNYWLCSCICKAPKKTLDLVYILGLNILGWPNPLRILRSHADLEPYLGMLSHKMLWKWSFVESFHRNKRLSPNQKDSNLWVQCSWLNKPYYFSMNKSYMKCQYSVIKAMETNRFIGTGKSASSRAYFSTLLILESWCWMLLQQIVPLLHSIQPIHFRFACYYLHAGNGACCSSIFTHFRASSWTTSWLQ